MSPKMRKALEREAKWNRRSYIIGCTLVTLWVISALYALFIASTR